jgi:hypothetical protein
VALADGTILRTHVLRPAWHFVLPDDIRWMIELTGPRVAATNAHWYRKFGLDDALCAKSNMLLGDALAGGHHLTRKQIAALLDEHGAPADGLQLGYLLMFAELDLLICSGAPEGTQRTYALLEERAPQAKSLARDEARVGRGRPGRCTHVHPRGGPERTGDRSLAACPPTEGGDHRGPARDAARRRPKGRTRRRR